MTEPHEQNVGEFCLYDRVGVADVICRIVDATEAASAVERAQIVPAFKIRYFARLQDGAEVEMDGGTDLYSLSASPCEVFMRIEPL